MSIKKILSLMLTISIIMTSFAATVFAAEEEQSPDAPYERAVAVLGALGIMEGKSETDFAPDDYLTRAEMSTIAVRFLGIDAEKTGNAESGFTDVDETHWGRPFINTATALDIIHGNGDGTFEPDGETTAEQAIKILVCALGYEPKAETRGEYPAGYLSVAAELGLLRGIDFSEGYSTPIPRWKVAMLVFHALEVDLMEVVYGETDYSVVTEGKTALGAYHGAERKNGTVAATYGGSLGGEYADADEITIDGADYTTTLNTAKYLGYYVDFYCTIAKGSEKSEVLAIFPIEDKAERVEVDFDHVVSVNVSANLDVEAEYYDKGGAKKRVRLAAPVIIYNGKAESFETNAEAKAFIDAHMNQGQLVFLRSSNLKDAKDVLFVENYNAYVISNVNPELDWISYNVYTSEGVKTERIDLETSKTPERRVFYYDEQGNERAMGDLVPGDVIMVYESSDKLVYNIHYSKKTVTGKIERTEKLDKTVSEGRQKTYETISEIDFSNITSSDYAAYYSFAGVGVTDDGVEYKTDFLGSSSSAPVADCTGFYPIDSLADDAFGGIKGKTLPEISSGTLLRLTKGRSEDSVADGGSWLMARNIFDKSKVNEGDTLKITMWVYTDGIWSGSTKLDDQENAASNIQMWLSASATTSNAGYFNATFNKDAGFETTKLKNNEWVPVSFEYEVTKGNMAVADVRLGEVDSYPYAKDTFIAGIKVERLLGEQAIEDKYVYPDDKNQYKLFIDGVGYEPVSSLYASLISKTDEVTLLLDLNDKIVGFVQGEEKSAYGLLMDVGVIYKTFGDDALIIKILDSDGNLNIYETLDQVYAWDGAQVSKVAAPSLITDEPADPMTSHYLWSTNNTTKFTGVYHSWMTDEVKSDAASRKIIYYETNPEGKIHKIIVPSMPEEHPDAKIVMLHNFGWNTNPWLDYHDVTYNVGARALSYTDGRYIYGQKDEYMYQISNFATVYEAVPMDYDDTDYRLIEGGITNMPESDIIDGMSWSNAQLYRYPGSSTLDFMVINPKRPSNGSDQHKVIIVDSIGETIDGYTLEGYSKGKPYSMPIKSNTRVMEHILITDLTEDWQYVTKDMLPRMAEEGAKPYNVFYESDIMGNQETPYVSPDSVFRGDLVRVLERNGEITSLEIVRRASTGVVTMYNATYPGAGMYSAVMQWNTCIRGEIVDIDRNLNILTVKGYYTTGTNPVVNITPDPVQSSEVAEYTSFLHHVNSDAAVYEVDTGKCYPAEFSDYSIGDEIFTWRYRTSPSDTIVFKTKSE